MIANSLFKGEVSIDEATAAIETQIFESEDG